MTVLAAHAWRNNGELIAAVAQRHRNPDRLENVMTDPNVEQRSLLDIALDHVIDGDNNVVVFRLDAGGGDYDFAPLEERQ